MEVTVPSSMYIHAPLDHRPLGFFPPRADPDYSGVGAVPTMASSVGFPAPPCGQEDDADDFEALLRDIHVLELPPTGVTPVPVAAAGAPVHAAAPASAALKKCKKRSQMCEPYDADIDATLRAMEKDAGERPSPNYLLTTQAGRMDEVSRADLVAWMDELSRFYDLAPGTLHRAASYAERFLSAASVRSGRHELLLLLGAAAVFTAAKYEDRATTRKLDAADLAKHGGFTRRQVLDMERDMVARLDFRLSGPTADTFVDHFTRHRCQQEEDGAADEMMDRTLAHHLADLALLNYRCVGFLPSVVAASAIFLARLALNPLVPPWSEELREVTGYIPRELAGCMDAIYEMHEIGHDWPGCTQMKLGCGLYYSLPPRSEFPPVYLEDP